jgi:hypothetical protein
MAGDNATPAPQQPPRPNRAWEHDFDLMYHRITAPFEWPAAAHRRAGDSAAVT